MPIFGEYETVQQISTTEEARLVTTVWKARKSGETDGRLYVIKSYASRPGRITPNQPPDELKEDWSLSFLEGIKRLKRAHTGGAAYLAPVHAFGLTPEGAWFATDYYERKTLKEYIDLLGRVDNDALRQVVYSVATGCLAFKHSGEGKTHGNLKPSNVLLAGKPCPLRRTPLHLTDPHPAPRQLATLETADQRTAADVPDQTTEIQDLRAIGELILQLVEGRLLRNSYEYNYPVGRSDKWDKLGKAGESWRTLCNRLLDPRLSLEKESLEKLELEYRPKVPRVKPAVLATILGGIILVGIVAYLGLAVGRSIRRHHAEREQRYEQFASAAGLAYGQGDYTNALANAVRALNIKARDPAAIKIRDAVQREINRIDAASHQEQEFQRLTNAAGLAYVQGNFTEARLYAVGAMNIKTNDPVATRIRDDAQREINQVEVARQQAEQFRRLTNSAALAYRQGNYTNALAEAMRALNIKINDPVATRIRDDAQRQINQIDVTRQQEQEFRRLTNSAVVAYRQGNYTSALADAVQALNIKANDPVVTRIRDDAQRQVNQMEVAKQQELEFRRLTNSAGLAYRQGNYTNALAEAMRALNIKANDPAATRIRDDAQREVNQMEVARQQELEFRRLTNSAGLAYRQGNYTNALADAVQALNIKANEPLATRIRDDAQRQINQIEVAKQQEQEFGRLTNSAVLAFRQGDYTNALAEAMRALNIKANDPVATRIRDDAQREVNQMAVAKHQEEEFRRLTNSAVLAFRQGDYTNALADAVQALDIQANDPVASKIRDDSQEAITRMAAGRQQEEEFRLFTNAAAVAYRQGNYTNARLYALRALETHRDDPVATRIRDEAQQAITPMAAATQQEQQFRLFTNAAGSAYRQGNHTNARIYALRALEIHTNDPVAIKIRDEAQAQLAGRGKGPGEERPGASHSAIAPSYLDTLPRSMARATDLIGKKVLPKGSFVSLGTLEDIALDLANGKLVMALVSSGSDPSAATPVPCTAFRAATARDRVIDWDKKTFLSVPHVPKANWTRGLTQEATSGVALIGKPLASQTGEPLGQVADLTVDLPTGRLVALVVKPEGGDEPDKRLYILPPASVHFDTNGGSLVLKASREQFVHGPYSYKDFSKTELLTPDLAAKAYEYYAPQKGGGGSG